MEKKTDYIKITAIILIGIAALWIFFGPMLITQLSWGVNFGGKDNNTGQIGDTIGGISAPIVGFVSIILLYLALTKQIESNKIQQKSSDSAIHEANFRFLYEEIKTLKIQAEQFKFIKINGDEVTGAHAFNFLSSRIKNPMFTIHEDNKSLHELYRLFTNIERLTYLINNLNTSSEYKTIVITDLNFIHLEYFKDISNNIYNCNVESLTKDTEQNRGNMNLLKQKAISVIKEINALEQMDKA